MKFEPLSLLALYMRWYFKQSHGMSWPVCNIMLYSQVRLLSLFITFIYILQEVTLLKEGGSLGFSIIGGTDHSCMPFGASEPGIFISHVSMLYFSELKM